jgi:hypothetical protein
MYSISIRLFYVNLVGPAGFEPTTFTQEPREVTPYGFLYDRSGNSSFSSRSQQTRYMVLLLEPVVIPV